MFGSTESSVRSCYYMRDANIIYTRKTTAKHYRGGPTNQHARTQPRNVDTIKAKQGQTIFRFAQTIMLRPDSSRRRFPFERQKASRIVGKIQPARVVPQTRPSCPLSGKSTKGRACCCTRTCGLPRDDGGRTYSPHSPIFYFSS